MREAQVFDNPNEWSKTMAKRPDQRHLRRAADAAAFEDSNKTVTVAVELKNTAPFGAVVFDPPPADLDAAIAELNEHNDFPYVAIECTTEKPAIRNPAVRDSFYFVEHDWWSPLVSWSDPSVKRADIASLTLVAKDKDGKVLANVNLGDELRKKNPRSKTWPDAIFFSFEALDKFLFPQLVGTYGVQGAWTERNRIRREIGDEVRSDFEEHQDDLAADAQERGLHRPLLTGAT